MLKLTNITWDGYRQFSTFGMTCIIMIMSVAFLLVQIAIFFGVQTSDIVWQGVCQGAQIEATTSTELILHVDCPGNDEFAIRQADVIESFVNKNSVFYCKKTNGSIMDNAKWRCSVPDKTAEIIGE